MQSFTFIFLGLNVMGSVYKLIKNYEVGDFAVGVTCERSCEEHMLKVQTTQVSEAFREWLATWPTCNLTREMHGQLFMFVSLINLPTLTKL